MIVLLPLVWLYIFLCHMHTSIVAVSVIGATITPKYIPTHNIPFRTEKEREQRSALYHISMKYIRKQWPFIKILLTPPAR